MYTNLCFSIYIESLSNVNKKSSFLYIKSKELPEVNKFQFIINVVKFPQFKQSLVVFKHYTIHVIASDLRYQEKNSKITKKKN